jgi:phosphoglycolate phosphatase
MTRPVALFDLDGTLVESAPGIIANVRHAMSVIGRPLDPAEDLTWVVGPPLSDIFARLLAPFGGEGVAEAFASYRATYDTVGMFESSVYPGIVAALDEFAGAGWQLFVATSKPAAVARRMLTHFGLADRFAAIYGSVADGTLAHKPDLLRYVIDTQGLTLGHTVMIGDRGFDISGAHANDLRAVGVLWGYGGLEELEQAGADALAEQPGTLLGHCTGLLHGA